MAAQSPVVPGEVVDGKYRVEKQIGVGGMGVVVCARHVHLGQLVALKFVRPEVAAMANVLDRFMREGRAAVQLKSEHVARVTDVGVKVMADGGHAPYLVMEYLEGGDLRSLLNKGPVPIEDAALYVVQACEALAEAHALGVVHRDFKPENVFLTRRPNGTPCVKVLDFGISRFDQDGGNPQLTATGAVIGTPRYMPPEQMKSAKHADARSDIWSVGAVLYQLLAGQPPFDGDSITAVCMAVATTEPAPLRQLRPEVPPALEAVVMRCLQKDPARRYQSVAELSADLAVFTPAPARMSLVGPISRAPGSAAVHPTVPFAGLAGSQPAPATVAQSPLSAVYPPGLGAPPGGPPPGAFGGPPPPTVAGAPVLSPTEVARHAFFGGVAQTPVPMGGPASVASSGAHAAIAGATPLGWNNPPAPRGPRWLLVGIGATLAVALLVTIPLVVLRSHAHDEPARPAASGVQPTPAKAQDDRSARPSIDAAPPAEPATSELASAPQNPAPQVVAPVVPPTTGIKPPPWTVPLQTAKPPPKNCNPPYVIDAQGKKRYKPECT